MPQPLYWTELHFLAEMSVSYLPARMVRASKEANPLDTEVLWETIQIRAGRI